MFFLDLKAIKQEDFFTAEKHSFPYNTINSSVAELYCYIAGGQWGNNLKLMFYKINKKLKASEYSQHVWACQLKDSCHQQDSCSICVTCNQITVDFNFTISSAYQITILSVWSGYLNIGKLLNNGRCSVRHKIQRAIPKKPASQQTLSFVDKRQQHKRIKF